MLKTSLMTALLAFSGLVAQAQTPAAPAAPAAPAKAASTAAAPAKAASATPTPAAAAATTKPASGTPAAEPEVKKSSSGVCHDKTSKSYKSTKNFAGYKTLDECLKSGGRAPKK